MSNTATSLRKATSGIAHSRACARIVESRPDALRSSLRFWRVLRRFIQPLELVADLSQQVFPPRRRRFRPPAARRHPPRRAPRGPAPFARRLPLSGIPIARVELLDEMQVRVCNAYSKLGLPEQPMLFLEFHGSEASVAEQATRFGEISGEFGSSGFEWTKTPEYRTRLWQARHDMSCRCQGGRYRCVCAHLAACRMRRCRQAGD
jgi:hypothetical protein